MLVKLSSQWFLIIIWTEFYLITCYHQSLVQVTSALPAVTVQSCVQLLRKVLMPHGITSRQFLKHNVVKSCRVFFVGKFHYIRQIVIETCHLYLRQSCCSQKLWGAPNQRYQFAHTVALRKYSDPFSYYTHSGVIHSFHVT